MIYCMQFLEENIEWLLGKIRAKKCSYFLIDMPGQVELYTNHDSLRRIIRVLHKEVRMQCCAVHLVDCSYLMDAHKYLSACTLSMTAKISFDEAPLLNVVSKMDLLGKLGRPQMNLMDLENFSGLSYLFWGMDGDFGDDDEDSEAARKRK